MMIKLRLVSGEPCLINTEPIRAFIETAQGTEAIVGGEKCFVVQESIDRIEGLIKEAKNAGVKNA